MECEAQRMKSKQAQLKREYLKILKKLIENRIVSTIELNKCLDLGSYSRLIMAHRIRTLRRIYGFDIRHTHLGIAHKVFYYLK